MKLYGKNNKALFKGKEVTVNKKITDFSNGKVSYELDNGKTVNASELSPIKVKTISVKPETPKETLKNKFGKKNESEEKNEKEKN
jgi:hypothetical protein